MESAFQLAAKARSDGARSDGARSDGAQDPPIRLEAHIDEVTEDGRVIGWACRPGHVARLQVGIFQGGRLIAVAATQGYRADLLAAGHGLGHCGFTARLREAPEPGSCELGLTLLGLPAVTRRFAVNVPPIRRPAAAPAAAAARWTDADILQHLHRFALPAQLAALGPARLVDGACQFVLGRWADAATIEAARRDAAAGGFDPDDFLRNLIESDERRAQAADRLPTPFDPRFPFTYPCAAPSG